MLDTWLLEDDVQQLLAYMLASPYADHQQKIRDLLPGGFTEMHAAALFRLSELKKLKLRQPGRHSASFTANRAVALHCWLFHFGGGGEAKLEPPPLPTGNSASLQVHNRASAAAKELRARHDALRLKLQRGEMSPDAFDAAVLGFTSARVDLHPMRSSTARPVAAGGGSTPPIGSEAEWQLQTDALVAFAMGTHARLGEGYAHAEGPCAVRLLSGNFDMLRQIAARFRGVPPRQLAPPDRELLRVRRINWQLELELQAERAASSALATELAQSQRATARALEGQAAAVTRLGRGQERAKRNLDRQEREHAAETRQLAQAVSDLRSQVAAERRAHRKELTEMELDWQHELDAHEQEAVDRLRDQEHELREYQQRMYHERNEAAAEAADRAVRVAELNAALERLRSSSKNGLLTQVAELQAKVRELGARRTLNQRRLRDANLDRQRATVAQEQAAAARAALGEYGISAEAERAATERADQLEKQVAKLQVQLKAATEEAAKFKAIAEPEATYFKQKTKSHAFTAAVDLAIIEALCLGVARNKVPALFNVFARFFRIKVPGHEIKVPGKWVDGKPTSVKRFLLYLPGATHVKEMAGVMNQLHKLQVGQWLLEYMESDTETSCCYIADGAESQQRDFLAQMLARRVDGKLELMSLDLAQLKGKTAEAQAAAFKESIDQVIALMEKAGKADKRAVDMLRRFIPTCSMNDRASPARRAARLVLGLDPDDMDNDPTCAEHALVNILEEGRKAMDAVLREMMNISDEQADGDASKVKAMRTCVGWFSSPACALIYQVAKYVALCSTKGYAIGQKFLEWMEARLADAEEQTELCGHSEDLLAICGSRMYVFFIDAAVTERLLSGGEFSLLTYLQEEEDLQAEGGGKLRKSILLGTGSPACMAAVRAMALIADSVLWKLLRAVKPSADKHVLDVLPEVWPKALDFFERGAADPASVIEGSLSMGLGGEAPAVVTPAQGRRAERGRLDMIRIRGAAVGDPLVERLVVAAFKAMAAGTRNHASEYLPGGKLCSAAVTPELRAKYDALVSTSTCVERVHAVGRDTDQRGKWQRPDTRAGLVCGKVDRTDLYACKLGLEELQLQLNVCRPAARAERKVTLKAMLIEQGRAKRKERDAKVSGKRAKRAAKAAELERLKVASPCRLLPRSHHPLARHPLAPPARVTRLALLTPHHPPRLQVLPLKTKWSELKRLGNTDLADQLKVWKLVQKQTGFTVTQPNRESYIIRLQNLMGKEANDLKPGDDGTAPEGVERKKRAAPAGTGGKGKKQKTDKITNDDGDEWEEEDEFPAIILERKVSRGVKDDGHRKGTVLYFISWPGYSAATASWEPEVNVGTALIEEWEASLEAEAELDAEEERELAEEAEMDTSD